MYTPFAHISKEKNGYKLVFERTFDVPVSKLWKAITDPEELKYWFADMDMEFRKGGRILIHFKDALKTTSYVKILHIEPEQRFEWDWEGEHAVWEIQSHGQEKSALILTYSKVHENYIRNVAAGFHVIMDLLDERLKGSEKLNEFGRGENDPKTIALKVHYDALLYRHFPQAVTEQPVVCRGQYSVPLNILWKALTDPAMLKKWYFPIENFKAEKGFKFSFEGTGSTGIKHMHLAVITLVEPLKTIQYSWQYDDIPGYSLVSWELKGNETSSEISLSHFGILTFKTNDPDFAPGSFKKGWEAFLNTELKNFLSSNHQELGMGN